MHVSPGTASRRYKSAGLLDRCCQCCRRSHSHYRRSQRAPRAMAIPRTAGADLVPPFSLGYGLVSESAACSSLRTTSARRVIVDRLPHSKSTYGNTSEGKDAQIVGGHLRRGLQCSHGGNGCRANPRRTNRQRYILLVTTEPLSCSTEFSIAGRRWFRPSGVRDSPRKRPFAHRRHHDDARVSRSTAITGRVPHKLAADGPPAFAGASWQPRASTRGGWRDPAVRRTSLQSRGDAAADEPLLVDTPAVALSSLTSPGC